MTDKATDSVHTAIERKLRAAFAPLSLEIINESGKHQGHSGHKGGVTAETGETHFRVKMTAADFTGMSLQARHRAVYQLLEQELRHSVHALALETKAPHE